MERIGIVGTGSMGSLLIDALIAAKALSPSQFIAYNRTVAKAEKIADRHPGLVVATSNAQVAKEAAVLLLCIKPSEYSKVLVELRDWLTSDHLLITITSPVSLEHLESLVPCPVARVVPSITNAAGSGVSLCEFGMRITPEWRDKILHLFSSISQPVEVPEPFLRVASDITSCGPAFVSYILRHMINDAMEETGISEEAASHLAMQMIIGMGELFKKEMFSFQALEKRVCVPGGITGEGLIALQNGIPGVFREVFRRTHSKFAEDVEMVKIQLRTVPPANGNGLPSS
ncbi:MULTISPECIES: late competence protein ComER [Brevibacillus]|jgi:competence protein ComER|uniref:late competence protein ComER n=1 Tax=Brevibacillus TaxID=55080 RepID=UPI00046AB9C2|nr:late competence protein ComER [Brevibacillus borstelensis]MBE5396719.1 late competence protein ComER [Brevibacillus borstelensis]MED1743344.1 late competence protein ComER [Brevibacillus borstelensis]NOU57747.1 late competence protein ComER [Brevibacillus borstelensis]